MKNICELQKLHLHAQRIFYLIPLLFLYAILLPNQLLLMADMDETEAVRVFGLAQEYLLLLELWFQYLGVRFLMSPELREVSCCGSVVRNPVWMFSNLLVSYGAFLPYGICLCSKSGRYAGNVPVLFFQCFVMGVLLLFAAKLLKSPLGGAALMAGYYFLCMTHGVPQTAGLFSTGRLPQDFEKQWYVIQISAAAVSIAAVNCMEKTRYGNLQV